MKNYVGREAGKCSKMVSERGDRSLFVFLILSSSFLPHFPFPFRKN
jgi:hypothetical protein